MVFSSTIFLFIFLPIVLLLYILAVKSKVSWLPNLVLLAASLFFYAWGEPVYIGIMVFSTVFDYINGRLIGIFSEKETVKKGILVLSVCGNLGILFFFKYTDFFLGTWNQISGAGLHMLQLALPVGISFYTFQTMSYTIDVYRGLVKPQKNFLAFAMYVCMFPQLIAGPIVRYADVEKEIIHRKHSSDLAAEGVDRFIIGLSKKVLLANPAGEIFTRLSGCTGGDSSVAAIWLAVIAFSFQIYFDFSGYSDMAIGLGKVFGFHFPENFDHPYESESITEFWRRWHMTLGTWFREYVYIPLGGNRRGIRRQIFNLAVVWFLTGFWHGAGWNFILWGVYYFVCLLLEKLVLKARLKRLPSPVRHLYTLLLIQFGWVIFAFTDMEQLIHVLKTMLGLTSAVLYNTQAIYEWKQYLPMLVVMAVGSTSLPKLAGKKIPKDLLRIMGIVLLVLDIAFLVSGSYNPFLYFRF